jgi:hypothetical protein
MTLLERLALVRSFSRQSSRCLCRSHVLIQLVAAILDARTIAIPPGR